MRSKLYYSYSIIIISLLALISFGCSDDDDKNPVGAGPGGSDSTTSFTIDQFPMEVGQSWTYEVESGLSWRRDTVEVRIVHTSEFIYQAQGTVWQYDNGSTIDTRWVSATEDKIEYYLNWYSNTSPPYRLYNFPMKAGDVWSSEDGGWQRADSGRVVGVTQTHVPAGTFDCTTIDFKYVGSSRSYTDDSRVWLCPNVGLVQFEQTTVYNSDTSHQRWSLLSTEFKPTRLIQLEDYPMAVGNQWDYVTYDSVAGSSGNMEVRIIEQYKEFDLIDSLYESVKVDSIFVWQFDSGDSVFSQPGFVTPSWIHFSSSTSGYVYPDHFTQFPLRFERGGIGGQTSSELMGVQTIEVPEGRFENAWQVRYYYECGDECTMYVTEWYVAGVGMVQRRDLSEQINYVNNTPVVTTLSNTVWQLLSYHVK